MTANADGYNAPEPYYNTPATPDLAQTPLSPDLLPVFDSSSVNNDYGKGNEPSLSFLSNAAYLAAFPRLPAKNTVTLTGTVTTGDTAYLNIYNGLLPGKVLQVSTVALAGDTLVTIAQKLVTAINQHPVLAQRGIIATEALVAGNQVITLGWPGPCGNYSTISGWSFQTNETLAIGGSERDADTLNTILTAPNGFGTNAAFITLGGTPTTGDISTVIFFNPLLPGGQTSVPYTTDGDDALLSDVATGLAAAIAAATALVTALGLTVVAQGAVVYLSFAASVGVVNLNYTTLAPVTETITLLANGGAQPSALAPTAPQTETITIGGTVTTGDVLTINLYATNFHPVHSVSYAAQGGDTTATIAAAIAALINADPLLKLVGCTASVLASAITVTWLPIQSGLIVFGSSVTALATELFATTQNPTVITLPLITAGSESTTNIATAFAALINANVVLTAVGVSATSSTTNVSILSNGNLSLTYSSSKTAGSPTTLTFTNAKPNTITVTGSATNLDTNYASFNTQFMGTVKVSAAVTTGQTATQQATALTASINANTKLAANGITATSSVAVVTVLVASPNQVPLILAWSDGTGADLETLTFTGSTTTGDVVNVAFTNATLPGGYHNVQYAVVGGDTTLTLLATHVKNAINADSALIAAGITATSSAGIVSLHVAADIGPLTFAASVNGIETATITGTHTATETVTITVTDANLAGGVLAVPYVIQAGDTTNTILAASITTALTTGAAGTALAAAGITATSSGAVISITSVSTKPTTYARTNSAGTTITLLATQTEIATLGGGSTEILTVAQTGFGTEVLALTQPSGGTGPIIPLQTWVYSPASFIPGDGLGSSQKLTNGKPYQLDPQTLNLLIQDGAPIL